MTPQLSSVPAGAGHVDLVEIGHRFLSCSGWIEGTVASLADAAAVLRIGDTDHPIDSFFVPDSAPASGPRAGFRIDVPRSPGDVRESLVELTVRGWTIVSSTVADLGYRSFVPTARFDDVSPEHVRGWIFDPGLWHGSDPDSLELVVGSHRLPIDRSELRPDVAFSAAQPERPLGFELALAETLERKIGKHALADLARVRDLNVSLVSLGLSVASAPIAFPKATPVATAPEAARPAAPRPAPAEPAAPLPARTHVAKSDKARVELYIDEAMAAPGAGVVVMGWLVDVQNAVRAMRVRSGRLLSAPLAEHSFPIARMDVLNSLGRKLGVQSALLGFHAYAALPGGAGHDAQLEIEFVDGSSAVRPLNLSSRTGRDAIMRILADVHITSGASARRCVEVFAEPVRALGGANLENSEPIEFTQGESPRNPRCSIIVPLYGRIDFLQYQTALLSDGYDARDEFLYVLDDPTQQDNFLALARLVHLQLGIPLRLLVLPRNLGFAGASNAGLAAARGEFVCFLNSDVVPADRLWLDRLIGTLAEDHGIGIAAPRLLFEDGTVQHIGMEMQPIAAMGDYEFPRHPAKGRTPPPGERVREVQMVTGACMVLRRTLAERIHGFSTDYIIGDFEDADLCMKVKARGLTCVVHDGITLFHLERQSQDGSSNRWRSNLTLLNAAIYDSHWRSGDTPETALA